MDIYKNHMSKSTHNHIGGPPNKKASGPDPSNGASGLPDLKLPKIKESLELVQSAKAKLS